jgi:hypothetical protein
MKAAPLGLRPDRVGVSVCVCMYDPMNSVSVYVCVCPFDFSFVHIEER